MRNSLKFWTILYRHVYNLPFFIQHYYTHCRLYTRCGLYSWKYGITSIIINCNLRDIFRPSVEHFVEEEVRVVDGGGDVADANVSLLGVSCVLLQQTDVWAHLLTLTMRVRILNSPVAVITQV